MGTSRERGTSQVSIEQAVLAAVRAARASFPSQPPGGDNRERFNVTAIEVGVGDVGGALWIAEVELIGAEAPV